MSVPALLSLLLIIPYSREKGVVLTTVGFRRGTILESVFLCTLCFFADECLFITPLILVGLWLKFFSEFFFYELGVFELRAYEEDGTLFADGEEVTCGGAILVFICCCCCYWLPPPPSVFDKADYEEAEVLGGR